MKQTPKKKNDTASRRRQAAYTLIRNLAQEIGVMHHSRDGHGYDEFIDLLQSGEFRLIFSEVNDENQTTGTNI